MYYSVLIEVTEGTGKNSKTKQYTLLNQPSKDRIIAEVVSPYCKGDDFLIDGYIVNKSKISRLKIVSSELSVNAIVEIKQKSIPPNVICIITKESVISSAPNRYLQDITNDVLSDYDNKKESKDIHKSLNTSKKKNLKKMNSPKKGKKVKFYNQNANHINTNIKNIKANSNKNKDSSSLSIYNNSHNSLNNIETSDKKMNKDKNIKISGSKIVPNTKNKSKTFIKKIFKKQKTKKENNSGSKSNDILKDLNLNHENELRNINYEESKEKALYTIDNKDKKNNEIHKEEIKNTINENEDKNNNNCIIF